MQVPVKMGGHTVPACALASQPLSAVLFYHVITLLTFIHFSVLFSSLPPSLPPSLFSFSLSNLSLVIAHSEKKDSPVLKIELGALSRSFPVKPPVLS